MKRLTDYLAIYKQLKQTIKTIDKKEVHKKALFSLFLSLIIWLIPILAILNLFVFTSLFYVLIAILGFVIILASLTALYFNSKALGIKSYHLVVVDGVLLSLMIILVIVIASIIIGQQL